VALRPLLTTPWTGTDRLLCPPDCRLLSPLPPFFFLTYDTDPHQLPLRSTTPTVALHRDTRTQQLPLPNLCQRDTPGAGTWSPISSTALCKPPPRVLAIVGISVDDRGVRGTLRSCALHTFAYSPLSLPFFSSHTIKISINCRCVPPDPLSLSIAIRAHNNSLFPIFVSVIPPAQDPGRPFPQLLSANHLRAKCLFRDG
jgi:hypothetical protein